MTTYLINLKDFETYLMVQCHLSELTIKAYISDINQFVEKFGNSIPDEAAVIGFLNQLSDREFTRSSVARKTSALRMYFYYLKHEHQMNVPEVSELFHSNLSLKLPKLVSQKTMEQCLDYSFPLSRFPRRDQCMIACLTYLGCRVSEVISIRMNSIFSDHIVIHGKGDKERVVPLCKTINDKLRLYLDYERKNKVSPWLFCNVKGHAFTRQTVTRVVNQLNLNLDTNEKLTPHSFRHMFASHLLEKGMGLRDIQLLLGHASITTTQIYMHVNKTALRHMFNDYHPLS